MILAKLLIFVVIGSTATSARQGKMAIFGTLVSYDQTKAVILTENKAKVTVPKKSVTPKVDGVIVGKGQVKAHITMDELLSHNPQINVASKKLVQKK